MDQHAKTDEEGKKSPHEFHIGISPNTKITFTLPMLIAFIFFIITSAGILFGLRSGNEKMEEIKLDVKEIEQNNKEVDKSLKKIDENLLELKYQIKNLQDIQSANHGK